MPGSAGSERDDLRTLMCGRCVAIVIPDCLGGPPAEASEKRLRDLLDRAAVRLGRCHDLSDKAVGRRLLDPFGGSHGGRLLGPAGRSAYLKWREGAGASSCAGP